MKTLTALFLTFVSMSLVAGFPGTAHAYMDPGTGSLLLQLLIGGVAGAIVTLKLYWKRVKGIFFKDQNDAES